MQALDHIQPGLPLKQARAQTMLHDNKRHDTTTLLATLNVPNGQAMVQCQQRRAHVEWSKFLKQIAKATPKDKTLHLISVTMLEAAIKEFVQHHNNGPKRLIGTKSAQVMLPPYLSSGAEAQQSATRLGIECRRPGC